MRFSMGPVLDSRLLCDTLMETYLSPSHSSIVTTRGCGVRRKTIAAQSGLKTRQSGSYAVLNDRVFHAFNRQGRRSMGTWLTGVF